MIIIIIISYASRRRDDDGGRETARHGQTVQNETRPRDRPTRSSQTTTTTTQHDTNVLRGRRREDREVGRTRDTRRSRSNASSAAQLFFVLLAETVSHREEVPTPLLVHVPHVRLLTGVLRVRLVDQMHEEKPVKKKRPVGLGTCYDEHTSSYPVTVKGGGGRSPRVRVVMCKAYIRIRL